MKKRLIERIKLNNSLYLELWDGSRVLAGDRWLVSVEAKVEVPIDSKYLEGISEADKIISILKKQYGDKVEYSYTQEKHFVDKREKDDVFNEFITNVKKNIIHYLSHPNFAAKILIARYRDLKRKAPWLFQ